jgi:hypothetical protein
MTQTTSGAKELLDKINANHMNALVGIISVEVCDNMNLELIAGMLSNARAEGYADARGI